MTDLEMDLMLAQAEIQKLKKKLEQTVRHGQWKKHTKIRGFVYCSACRDVYLDEEWLADGKWGYCPNCGAKMDGGVDSGNETDS